MIMKVNIKLYGLHKQINKTNKIGEHKSPVYNNAYSIFKNNLF